MQASPEVSLMYKTPKTGLWECPPPLLFNGRGYSCISTDPGPLWVPSRWTKPAVKTAEKTVEKTVNISDSKEPSSN